MAKTSVGRGGDAAAIVGATVGAGDGNNGGGKDCYLRVDPLQEEGGTGNTNVGASSDGIETLGGAKNALATTKRGSARIRKPTAKVSEEAAQHTPRPLQRF